MEYSMPSSSDIAASPVATEHDKSTPGRGYVVVIYGLYIGSIMAVVTAPLGALIAHFRWRKSASWLDTHLQFQLRTFWLGTVAAIVALLLWQSAGRLGMSSIYAWIFGYLFFTFGIIWMMGRCAVGIHRLTSNRGIDAPKSWLFGLA